MFRSPLRFLLGAIAPTASSVPSPYRNVLAIRGRNSALPPKSKARTPAPRAPAVSLLTVILAGALSSPVRAGTVELVMPLVNISAQGDSSVFATPMDVQGGQVVVAHVTDPDSTTPSGYVNTVIRKGRKVAGAWQWEQKTVNNMTLLDPYHTQPSVAFDRNGYVHLAYNMHNLPWQYMISDQPYSIYSFMFYGQAVSKAELDALRLENKTRFPNLGRALIPGNQVTYPAFFKDRAGELYVTYRYAMRPARDWNYRARAAGIAHFDADKWTWSPIGGVQNLAVGDFVHAGSADYSSVPFAYDPNYEPYLVTLAFDNNNAMHAIWTWWDRASTLTGETNVFPSYKKVTDVTVPTSVASASTGRIPSWASTTGFNTPKSVAIAANGDVLAIFEPKGAPRKLVRRNAATGAWSAPVDTPWSASKIMVDRNGNEWAFASGFTLFKRSPGGGAWSKPITVGTGLCDPRPIYSEQENSFYIHGKLCSGRNKAAVYRYQVD